MTHQYLLGQNINGHTHSSQDVRYKPPILGNYLMPGNLIIEVDCTFKKGVGYWAKQMQFMKHYSSIGIKTTAFRLNNAFPFFWPNPIVHSVVPT
jgi:hypothetical protein